MNSATLPTLREWNLELSVQADEPDFLQVQCAGDVSLPNFRPEHDPLVKLLGPQVYSRKLLLNMEKTNFLDTSGVSWLISCQEQCHHAGGILVLYAVPLRHVHVRHHLDVGDAAMSQFQGQPGQRAQDPQVADGNFHRVSAAGQKQVAGVEARRPFQQEGDGLLGRLKIQLG